jgi:murein DD-endopeptidase
VTVIVLPTARQRFVAAVESLLGKPVMWAQKGPDVFDCSGSVTYALKQAGGQDLRHTHNAQALFDASRALVVGELPISGDLIFYGHDKGNITHVAVYAADGGVISADGATSHITDLRVASANPANRVRRHASVNYRRDTPFVAVHRNTFVDALDKVER